ncbi:MAG TPA: hypothetical protein VEC60_03345 [Reyranella sp.]|nr:hypothetical protein [Reyranella sp.]
MPRLSSDFSATEPGAAGNYTIDFTGNVPPGAILASAAWSLSVQRTLPGYSADGSPSSRLVGDDTIDGPATVQRIENLVAGNDYLVSATGTMSDGQRVVLWCVLPCRGVGQPAPSAGVDWADPCARATALRSAYYTLLSGGQEVEIRTRTLDAEELVRFTPANRGELLIDLRAAEAECAALTGAPNANRRFAITAGAIRRCL